MVYQATAHRDVLIGGNMTTVTGAVAAVGVLVAGGTLYARWLPRNRPEIPARIGGLDGRAPFNRIADVLGVSDQTVARRFRRLRSILHLRVLGISGASRLGRSTWLLRLCRTPDTAEQLANALAMRPDTAYVGAISGGTEVMCAMKPATRQARDELLLDRFQRTPRITSVSAHCPLHRFYGGPLGWLSSYWRKPTRRCSPLWPATDGLTHRTPREHRPVGGRDPAVYQSAAAALREVTRDGEALALQIPSGGSQRELRSILDWLDAAGTEADELTVHTPGLDDVFFALTGPAGAPDQAAGGVGGLLRQSAPVPGMSSPLFRRCRCGSRVRSCGRGGLRRPCGAGGRAVRTAAP